MGEIMPDYPEPKHLQEKKATLKLSASTARRLRLLKAELGERTLSDTVDRLLDYYALTQQKQKQRETQ